MQIFQPEVKYHGHVLSGDGIRVNATKVKAVNDWPTPKTSKEVQQFLGLSNFFGKFIQGYSSVAAPLIAIANRHDTRPGKYPLSRNPDFSDTAAMLLQRLDPDDPLHARDLTTDILAAYESDDWFDDPRNV
eukprot:gene13945-biopygen23027